MSALRYLVGAVQTEYAGNLQPINQVKKNNKSDLDWVSTGDDPAFKLGSKLPIYAGWYMIEMNMTGVNPSSKFYFDFGEGLSEENSVVLTGKESKICKRIVYLNRPANYVRFDPIERAGSFSVTQLKFVPVSRAFAHARIHKKLLNKSCKLNAETYRALREERQGQIRFGNEDYQQRLLSLYNDTFRQESYENWIHKYEKPLFGNREKLEADIAKFKLNPKVSIVVPVYNIAEEYLRPAIDSVRSQVYTNWQLCLADDASTEPHVRRVLQEYADLDDRILVHYSEINEHISATSNKALAMADGDFVALLDHDDLLADHALYSMIHALQDNPDAQMFYSDEDKLDENGARKSPFFKPDWNLDLFFSNNYLCHFSMLSKSLIDRIGGFRVGVEGSQDYDLFLRAADAASFKNIVHVPHILYHWRMIEGSTASGPEHKSYTSDSGIKALKDYFQASGQEGVSVEHGIGANLYRVRYPVPDPQPLVSLIIPTRNKLELLDPCIRSILEKTGYKNFEIVIVDNQSDELDAMEYLAQIAKHPKVSVLEYDENFNYSAINNYAVSQVNGDIIGLINNDIEVISPDWLSEMVSNAIRQDIGCVGAKLYYPDNTIQHAGVVLGIHGVAGHIFSGIEYANYGYFSRAVVSQNYSAVTAACLVVTKEIYEEVGGLDEENFKVAFNDIDFCLRVRDAGYRNFWTPYAELYHHESKSRGQEDTPEKLKRFNAEVAAMKLRWSDRLLSDPAYSPNLTLNDRYSQINN